MVDYMRDYDDAYARMDQRSRELRNEVSKMQQASGTLSQQDQFFDSVMRHLDTPVCFLDTSLKSIRINAAMASLGGVAMPILAWGKDATAMFGEEAGGRIVEAANSVMDTGQPGSAGSANDTYPGGSEAVLEWHCHPVSAGGEVVAVLVLGTPAKVE